MGLWIAHLDHVLIESNESHHNQSRHFDSVAANGDGFNFEGGVTNSVMQYNYAHDNDGAGYSLCEYSGAAPHSGNTLRYNISSNDSRRNNYGGISIGSNTTLSPIVADQVYNNVVILTPDAYSPPTLRSSNASFQAHNNVFITIGGPAALLHGDVLGANPKTTGNYYLSSPSTADPQLKKLFNSPTTDPTVGSSADFSVLASAVGLPTGSPLVGAGVRFTPTAGVCTTNALRYCAGAPLPLATVDFFGKKIPLSGPMNAGVSPDASCSQNQEILSSLA